MSLWSCVYPLAAASYLRRALFWKVWDKTGLTDLAPSHLLPFLSGPQSSHLGGLLPFTLWGLCFEGWGNPSMGMEGGQDLLLAACLSVFSPPCFLPFFLTYTLHFGVSVSPFLSCFPLMDFTSNYTDVGDMELNLLWLLI